MVPLAAVPPLLLSTDHVTPEFEGSLKTVPVNCTVCTANIVTAARLGVRETAIGGGGRPAADLKAAIAAPHGLKAPRVAVAEAGPIVVCSWSSVTSLVLGSAGTKS